MTLSSMLNEVLCVVLLISKAVTAEVGRGIDVSDINEVITRDVAIIGGGSSGTYSAINLYDRKKSVIVVEKEDVLGGHANTYTDPKTATKVDYGVVVFDNITVVRDYFDRLKVPLVKQADSGKIQTEFVDFSTGKKVRSFSPPSNRAFLSAIEAYAAQISKFPNLQGSFKMAYPVHPDLLLPFGKFVEKYNLGDMMYNVFAYNQGYAPLLNISTIYMVKYLNLGEIHNFERGFLITKHLDTGEVYDSAAKVLGRNVLLNSYPISINRESNKKVKVLVQTPHGKKLIVAKKVICSIPPTLSNMKVFDLSKHEESLFAQFYANGYYTALLKDTGLPANTYYMAADSKAKYGIPKLPGAYSVSHAAGTDLTHIYYGLPSPLPDSHVKGMMIKVIARLQKARGINSTAKFATFRAHAPFNLMVSNEAIEEGFYKKLLALQGQRNTYYVGAAWQAQDSSAIWNNTKHFVLPRLLADLDT